MSSRRALTLIDLMAVLAIAFLLAAVAVPVLGQAWEAANQVRCKSNLRILTTAFFAFAMDHDNHLPGSLSTYSTDRDPEHWDWLFGQHSLVDGSAVKSIEDRLKLAPQNGTIWKYLSNNSNPGNPAQAALQQYRCPSLQFQKPGSGQGSNGRFDYAAFSCFSGASLLHIRPISELHYPVDTGNPKFAPSTEAPWHDAGLSLFSEFRPTPLICQEEAGVCINLSLEGQHRGIDQMSHLHSGGSFYGGLDGAVYFVIEPVPNAMSAYSEGMARLCKAGPASAAERVWRRLSVRGTALWWQAGPLSGKPVSLDGDGGWGWWEHR